MVFSLGQDCFLQASVPSPINRAKKDFSYSPADQGSLNTPPLARVSGFGLLHPLGSALSSCEAASFLSQGWDPASL